MSDWEPRETGRHQDHVIAHVLGATVLGHFVLEQAAHFLLDIGFIWSVFLDGEMALLPGSMALKELDADEAVRSELLEEAGSIQAGAARQAGDLRRITPAPDGCLIEEVSFYDRGDERRVLIECEGARLCVETSLSSGEVRVRAE